MELRNGDRYGRLVIVGIEGKDMKEARQRMSSIVKERFPEADITGILERQIIQGNTLKMDIEKLWEDETE